MEFFNEPRKEQFDQMNEILKDLVNATIGEPVGIQKPKRYGIRINKNDSNPETRIEYILDAEGFTPARMNYAEMKFDYGSWADIWFVRDNYPCMLKYDGTEDYRLDPNDYSKKLDGTDSDVADITYTGNAMSCFPLVWINQFELDGWEYIILCEKQYNEHYKAFAHTRTDGSIMDKLYLAMFRGSEEVGETVTKLRSISGLQPMHSKTAADEIAAAKANGTLWDTRTWAHRNLINCLLTVISKNDNSQTAFGNGNLNYQSALETKGVLLTGTLNVEGQFMGYSDNTHQVKVFHMEAWWGDQWERIQGFLNIDGDIRIKMTPPYNLVGTDFISTGLTPSGASGGYIKESKMTEYGRIPVVTGASSNTYQCDGLWFINSGTNVARVGGSCGYGVLCGFSCVSLGTSAAHAYWDLGAALSCEQPLVA